MSLFDAAAMRPDSLAEFASGCVLEAGDIGDDDKIDAAIARMTNRFEDWTADKYESFAQTIDVDGSGGVLLPLPYRTTAVSSVTFRLTDGTYTSAQDPTAYYLSSSLNAAGDDAITDQDYLEVAPFATGFTLTDTWSWDPYRFPSGPRAIRVAGTFGWTVPPEDAKRAVAMLVWNHFKPVRADLGMASGYSDATGLSVAVAPIDDDHPSGIRDVDAIVQRLRRNTHIGVG